MVYIERLNRRLCQCNRFVFNIGWDVSYRELGKLPPVSIAPVKNRVTEITNISSFPEAFWIFWAYTGKVGVISSMRT